MGEGGRCGTDYYCGKCCPEQRVHVRRTVSPNGGTDVRVVGSRHTNSNYALAFVCVCKFVKSGVNEASCAAEQNQNDSGTVKKLT